MWLESLLTFADEEEIIDHQILLHIPEIHQATSTKGENKGEVTQNSSAFSGKLFWLLNFFEITNIKENIIFC